MKKAPIFFIFILTFSLLLSITETPVYAADIEDVDAMIAAIPSDWPEAPEIAAETAVLMDADSGEILYAKNATKSMYPASTTKLMTALLTLESASLQDIVDFSQTAVSIPAGSSHIGMRRGEQMVLKECLYGLLLPSANEVANALAEHVSGSIRSFVIRMNERAYQLGAVNTDFVNANGLHDESHHTSAYDLALIMKACAENSTFVEIASTPSYVHHSDDLLPKDIPMTNTHLMIRSSSEYYNSDVVCGKTGHTDESGYNLVTYASRDGMNLIAVVMGCEDGKQYASTQSLLDYGFNYFHQVLPAELDDSLLTESHFTSSALAIPTPSVSLLSPDSAETILLPDNVTFDMLKKTSEEVSSGIKITYTYDGYPLGSVTLSSETSVSSSPLFKKSVAEELVLSEPDTLTVIDGWLIVALLGLLLVIAVIIIFIRNWYFPKRKRKKVP